MYLDSIDENGWQAHLQNLVKIVSATTTQLRNLRVLLYQGLSGISQNLLLPD